jgi:uncharacterized protein
LALLAGAVQGGQEAGLYEAQVPVASQAAPEREQALRAALAQVLVKVSGDRSAPQRSALAQALANAGQYVQQFGYRTPPEASEGLLLWARFDADGVARVLREAGLPVWAQRRPVTLVWIAVQDEQRRELVSAGGGVPDVQAALETAAHSRGLPILLPLLDLEDQRALDFADVWGGFGDVVLRASSRYQPEAVLVGRLQRERSGQWRARWTLYEGTAGAHWESEGHLEAAVAAGIERLADDLAARYVAPSGAERGRLALAVTDVMSLEAYARADRYLRELGPVEEVQVLQVEPERVVFLLEVRGGQQALERAIAPGGVLQPLGVMPTDGVAPSALQYRLLPWR